MLDKFINLTIIFRGSLSVTPMETMAVAQNLLDGFDVYDISTPGRAMQLSPERVLRHEIGPNVRLPSLLIHKENALAGASTVGRVRVWSMKNYRKHFSLKHEGELLPC